MDADRLVKRDRAKQEQRKSRAEAVRRGTPGSLRHKHKAQSSQKPYGGKMAR